MGVTTPALGQQASWFWFLWEGSWPSFSDQKDERLPLSFSLFFSVLQEVTSQPFERGWSLT